MSVKAYKDFFMHMMPRNGKIDDALIEKMNKLMPDDSVHYHPLAE
jgi:hypothetical protein